MIIFITGFNPNFIKFYFISRCQGESSHDNLIENAHQSISERDNCLVRRVKCGNKGPIHFNTNQCEYQMHSSPPIYHHNSHNGKRLNPKLKPLKVKNIIDLCILFVFWSFLYCMKHSSNFLGHYFLQIMQIHQQKNEGTESFEYVLINF